MERYISNWLFSDDKSGLAWAAVLTFNENGNLLLSGGFSIYPETIISEFNTRAIDWRTLMPKPRGKVCLKLHRQRHIFFKIAIYY